MRSKSNIFFLIFVSVTIFFACKSALYVPTSENTMNNADISRMKKGRELYVQKCAACHTLYLPEKYNKKEWSRWVSDMAPKANLTNEEEALILSYLTKNE